MHGGQDWQQTTTVRVPARLSCRHHPFQFHIWHKSCMACLCRLKYRIKEMVFSTLGPAKPSVTQEVCKISNKVLNLKFLF